MKSGKPKMSKVIDYVILAVAGCAFIKFAHWTYKDVKLEKRPPVTDEMVDEAFSRMLDENEYIFDD